MTENNEQIASSSNPADDKRKALADLFPEAFSEGRLDIAALKRALGESDVIDGGERYALSWAGKSDAYKVLQTPTTATHTKEIGNNGKGLDVGSIQPFNIPLVAQGERNFVPMRGYTDGASDIKSLIGKQYGGTNHFEGRSHLAC